MNVDNKTGNEKSQDGHHGHYYIDETPKTQIDHNKQTAHMHTRGGEDIKKGMHASHQRL